MEVYIPYIIGSTMSAIIGNITYNYMVSNKNLEDHELVSDTNDTNDYSLIYNNLLERKVNSNKETKPLGATLKNKMERLQQIIEKECGTKMHINNTKKVRQKWLKLIDEYENSSHDEFVFNHANKHFKDLLLKM